MVGVSMHVCMCLCLSVHVFMHMCACPHVCICVHMCVRVHVCMHLCSRARACLGMHMITLPSQMGSAPPEPVAVQPLRSMSLERLVSGDRVPVPDSP